MLLNPALERSLSQSLRNPFAFLSFPQTANGQLYFSAAAIMPRGSSVTSGRSGKSGRSGRWNPFRRGKNAGNIRGGKNGTTDGMRGQVSRQEKFDAIEGRFDPLYAMCSAMGDACPATYGQNPSPRPNVAFNGGPQLQGGLPGSGNSRATSNYEPSVVSRDTVSYTVETRGTRESGSSRGSYGSYGTRALADDDDDEIMTSQLEASIAPPPSPTRERPKKIVWVHAAAHESSSCNLPELCALAPWNRETEDPTIPNTSGLKPKSILRKKTTSSQQRNRTGYRAVKSFDDKSLASYNDTSLGEHTRGAASYGGKSASGGSYVRYSRQAGYQGARAISPISRSYSADHHPEMFVARQEYGTLKQNRQYGSPITTLPPLPEGRDPYVSRRYDERDPYEAVIRHHDHDRFRRY